MNYLIRKLTCGFAAALMPLTLGVPSVWAQPAAEVGAQPVVAKINPNLIKINRRALLPFKEFEILDPINKSPISRETVLPDGISCPWSD
jgi:hypothetical protein